MDRHGVADSGSRVLLCPNGGEAKAIVAGERWLPAGSRGSGWVRETAGVFSVVGGLTGGEEIVGGELRGGGSFGSKVILWRRWLPIKIKQGNEFTGG